MLYGTAEAVPLQRKSSRTESEGGIDWVKLRRSNAAL
jgi:hypothetical protein